MYQLRRPSSETIRSVFWMLAGGASFTVMGALIKFIGEALPIMEIVFVRMAVALFVVLPWLARRSWTGVATRHLGLHFVRAATGSLSLLCLVYSLSHLILADAIALSFTTPLWMIITAAALLGEATGAARALATGWGFVGVLFIVQPQIDPDPAMIAALGAAFLGSLSLACVKKLSAYDSALTITFYFSFFGTLFSAVPAILTWVAPTITEILVLVGIGVSAVSGLLCSATAYRLAPATVVAPVDFARLPMAAAIGFFVFNELPDAWMLLGTLIIVSSILRISRSPGAKGKVGAVNG